MDSSLVDRLINDYLSRYNIPGLSVGIARNGSLLHAAGYGFANLEHRVPATPDTIYQTASVGKQFTASLVLLLAEGGILRFDDLIAPYFPTAPAAWNSIGVRHLLTHTSGISDEGYSKLNLRLDYTDSQLVDAIAAEPLDFAPGTAWKYSNCGYILLGILIARITGRFYGDLLVESIFRPLDMATARVIAEDDIIPNRAAGYRLEGALLLNQEYVSPTLNRTADGGLYITVLDLAKWDRCLRADSLLSPANREVMWTPIQIAGGASYPYGFGWSITTSPHGRIVEHDGEWQGFSTHFMRYLEHGLSIMVLSNLSDAPVSELARALAALYMEST